MGVIVDFSIFVKDFLLRSHFILIITQTLCYKVLEIGHLLEKPHSTIIEVDFVNHGTLYYGLELVQQFVLLDHIELESFYLLCDLAIHLFAGELVEALLESIEAVSLSLGLTDKVFELGVQVDLEDPWVHEKLDRIRVQ